jgi:hypothetical protein
MQDMYDGLIFYKWKVCTHERSNGNDVFYALLVAKSNHTSWRILKKIFSLVPKHDEK